MTAACILAASLAISLWLLLRGIRGQRIGNEPRCRKCSYELSGLTSARCPECGWEIQAKRVRHGHRQRRPASLIVGLLMLLIGGGLIVSFAASSRWLPRCPVWLVILRGELGKEDAFKEFERRLNASTLTPSQAKLVGDYCLRKQRSALESPNDRYQPWIDLLAMLCVSSLLTPSQEKQFYDQMTSDHWELCNRPIVREGEPMETHLRFRSAVPSEKGRPSYVPRISIAENSIKSGEMVWYDSPPGRISMAMSPTAASHLGYGLTSGDSVHSLSPRLEGVTRGKHHFEYRINLVIFSPNWQSIKWSRDITLAGDVEVIARKSADTVHLVKPKNADEAYGNALVLESKKVIHDSKSIFPDVATDHWGFEFKLRKPVSRTGVFRIRVNIPDDPHDIGTMIIRAGTTKVEHWEWTSPEAFEPAKVTVILRPDVDAARNTTDIFEISDEKIELGPVLFGRASSPPRGPAR